MQGKRTARYASITDNGVRRPAEVRQLAEEPEPGPRVITFLNTSMENKNEFPEKQDISPRKLDQLSKEYYLI